MRTQLASPRTRVPAATTHVVSARQPSRCLRTARVARRASASARRSLVMVVGSRVFSVGTAALFDPSPGPTARTLRFSRRTRAPADGPRRPGSHRVRSLAGPASRPRHSQRTCCKRARSLAVRVVPRACRSLSLARRSPVARPSLARRSLSLVACHCLCVVGGKRSPFTNRRDVHRNQNRKRDRHEGRE